MKEDHLDWGSVSSAVEGLLFDSHSADESDEEDVDVYFGDDCTNIIEIWLTLAILNILGPFLFVLDFVEI